MNKNTPKLFGFNLTQKGSSAIYLLSLFGVLICVHSLSLTSLTIFIESYYVSIDGYIYQMIFEQLPACISLSCALCLFYYTLARCNKITKFYNPLDNSDDQPPKYFGFCLTRQQYLGNFIIALIGLFICVFLYIVFFQAVYWNSQPLVYENDEYIIYCQRISVKGFIIFNLGWLILIFMGFIICCYTLSRCGKAIKYFRQKDKGGALLNLN